MRQHAERRALAVLDRLEGVENPVGVEVGVYRGDMSAKLLKLRDDLTLYMVDNWKAADERAVGYRRTLDPRAKDGEKEQKYHMKEAKRVTAFAAKRRHIVRADSADAAAETPDGSRDFVFIDADHSYEAVRDDIAAWLPKIRPGGLLCGHDYSKPGERSAVGWPGVVRAVDEAVSERRWNLERGNEATWFVRLP
jgi:hypothetical protein